MSTIELLIKAGDAGTQAFKQKIAELRETASQASKATHRIQSERIITLGKSVELERIKRNCMALYTLLDMAHDASEYISSEIRDIIKAIEEAEEIEKKEKKSIVARQQREIEAAKQKRHRERIKKNTSK